MPFNLEHPYFENVSIEDFDRRYDSIEETENKFNFLITYLLSHGMNNNQQQDLSFDKLLHHAKQKFAKSVLADRERFEELHNTKVMGGNLNPERKEMENEFMQEAFLKDPINVVRASAKDVVNNLKKYSDPENDPKMMKKWQDNCFRLAKNLKDRNNAFREYEKRETANDITDIITSSFMINEKVTMDQIFEKNKGGFFERMFNTTSPEYNNLVAATKRFNDPEDALHGNTDNLEAATRGYLKHKFPDLKDDELPTPEQIARLSGAGKGRCQFCLNVLDAIKKHKESTDLQAEFKFANTENIDAMANDGDDQIDFQKQVYNDVEELSADDKSMENENNNIIQKDKEIDELEQDDLSNN